MTMLTLKMGSIGLIMSLLIGGIALQHELENLEDNDLIPKVEYQVASPQTIVSEKKTLADIQIKQTEPVKLIAFGDIMLGRYVETLMNIHGDNYPFARMGDLINNQDIVFANFEGPIVSNHTQTPDFTTSFDFDPKTAQIMANHGFNLVSLGNNHTLDKGLENFQSTIQYLNDAGVYTIGHSREESLNYTYETEINNQKLAFLSFNEAVNPLFDENAAIEATRTLAKDDEKFVVVSIHWGIEYQLQSANFQQEIAHNLIDAGADLIIGHHPHVTQEVEVYQNRMIFYSLGNFIFDQYFSADTQEELAFEMTLNDKTVTYSLIPIQSIKSQPALMEGIAKDNWLEGLANRTYDKNISNDIQNGLLTLQR